MTRERLALWVSMAPSLPPPSPRDPPFLLSLSPDVQCLLKSLPDPPNPCPPPRVWAGLTSSLPVASWDFWAVGREARLQGEEMVCTLLDNFLASLGSHGECQRALLKRVVSSRRGRTSHCLHPLCLHTMSSPGFRAKECIQHQPPALGTA